MHESWHVILHALIDTLKIAPILLAVYFLIEFLEYKRVMDFQKSKLLKGKSSPVFGSLFGSLPQCGFSVVSTDLFTKGFVSIGALLAVYIATSDEALPIMLSHSDKWAPLLGLIVGKIALGIVIGYLAMWLYPRIFKNNKVYLETANHDNQYYDHDEHNHNHDEHNDDEHNHDDHHKHNHDKHDRHNEFEGGKYSQSKLIAKPEKHIGCCNHTIENSKFDFKHPLLHCLKILLFILIINIIFGFVIHFVGEDRLAELLAESSYLQPLLAVIIGLIPNCASSVVITELYLLGGLSFGAILAGLCVNAGLGLMVLFKQDKNIKEIVFILSLLIIPSLLVGYGLHFVI